MADEKKEIDKQTLIIIIVVATTILISFLIWNNIKQREIELQKQKLEQEISQEENRRKEDYEKEIQRERDYHNCMENAHNNYHSRWIAYCRGNNIVVTKRENGRETCQIPSYDAIEFDNILQRAQEMCVEKYK